MSSDHRRGVLVEWDSITRKWAVNYWVGNQPPSEPHSSWVYRSVALKQGYGLFLVEGADYFAAYDREGRMTPMEEYEDIINVVETSVAQEKESNKVSNDNADKPLTRREFNEFHAELARLKTGASKMGDRLRLTIEKGYREPTVDERDLLAFIRGMDKNAFIPTAKVTIDEVRRAFDAAYRHGVNVSLRCIDGAFFVKRTNRPYADNIECGRDLATAIRTIAALAYEAATGEDADHLKGTRG